MTNQGLIEQKNKGGRPRKTLNPSEYKQLESMCGTFATGEECAAWLNMDYDTLNAILKRDGWGGFSEYYRVFSNKGKVSLRSQQYKVAMSGDVQMLKHLGNVYLGQAERHIVEQTVNHQQASPLQSIDLDQLSEEQLAMFKKLVESQVDPGGESPHNAPESTDRGVAPPQSVTT